MALIHRTRDCVIPGANQRIADFQGALSGSWVTARLLQFCVEDPTVEDDPRLPNPQHLSSDLFYLATPLSLADVLRCTNISTWVFAIEPWSEPPLSPGEAAFIRTADDALVGICAEGWSDTCRNGRSDAQIAVVAKRLLRRWAQAFAGWEHVQSASMLSDAVTYGVWCSRTATGRAL